MSSLKSVLRLLRTQARDCVCRVLIAGLLPAVPLSATTTDSPQTEAGSISSAVAAPLPLRLARQWTETELAMNAPTVSDPLVMPTTLSQEMTSDRIWLINTRHLTCDVCRINLQSPDLRVSRLDRRGCSTTASLEEYTSTFQKDRPRLIYIHGNRRTQAEAIDRGMDMYRELTNNERSNRPIDWVIWSWQSDREALPLRDARLKAEKTISQSFYLAWLLSHHAAAGQPTSLIGFSFGARIATGGLHVLAGGSLKGRKLESPTYRDAGIDVGLIAPAVQGAWLKSQGSHGLATQNIDQMVVLYNPNDTVLKNYWLVDQVRGATAMGHTGPRNLAARADGTPVPVRKKNCGQTVGNHHRESEYFRAKCYAGRELSSLIESSLIRQ